MTLLSSQHQKKKNKTANRVIISSLNARTAAAHLDTSAISSLLHNLLSTSWPGSASCRTEGHRDGPGVGGWEVTQAGCSNHLHGPIPDSGLIAPIQQQYQAVRASGSSSTMAPDHPNESNDRRPSSLRPHHCRHRRRRLLLLLLLPIYLSTSDAQYHP